MRQIYKIIEACGSSCCMPVFLTDSNYPLELYIFLENIKHRCFVINVITTFDLTRHGPPTTQHTASSTLKVACLFYIPSRKDS